MPSHAAAMRFGLPNTSYVPTISTEVGKMMVIAPIDFFIVTHLIVVFHAAIYSVKAMEIS